MLTNVFTNVNTQPYLVNRNSWQQCPRKPTGNTLAFTTSPATCTFCNFQIRFTLFEFKLHHNLVDALSNMTFQNHFSMSQMVCLSNVSRESGKRNVETFCVSVNLCDPRCHLCHCKHTQRHRISSHHRDCEVDGPHSERIIINEQMIQHHPAHDLHWKCLLQHICNVFV